MVRFTTVADEPDFPGEQNQQDELVFDDLFLTTATQAKSLEYDIKQANRERLLQYAAIKASYDGMSPYENNEIGYERSNTNFRRQERVINKLALNYSSAINNSSSLIDFKYLADVANRNMIEMAVEQRFTDFFRNQLWFQHEMSLKQNDMLLYGGGLLHFPSKDDFHFQRIDFTNFFCAQDTSIDVDDWEVIYINHDFSIYDLIRHYQSGSRKWNREVLETILLAHFHEGDDKVDNQNPEVGLQEIFRKTGGSYPTKVFNERIPFVSVFWKRINGKIAKATYAREIEHGEFAFENDNAYDYFGQAFRLFPLFRNVESVHSLKGWGHITYNMTAHSTRFDNHVIDAGSREATVFLKNSGVNNQDDLREILIDHGSIVLLQGADIEQQAIRTNLNAILAVKQDLKREINESTYIDGLDFMEQFGDGRGYELAQLQLKGNARVHKSLMRVYTEHLTPFYQELVKKVLSITAKNKETGELKKRFVDPLKEQGVPEEIFKLDDSSSDPNLQSTVLPDDIEVFAAKSFGTGSQLADQLMVRDLEARASFFGDRGLRRMREISIATIAGADMVPELLPPEDFANEPTAQHQKAIQENIVLSTTTEVGSKAGEALLPVTRDDAHQIHAPIHNEEMAKILEQWQREEIDILTADVRVFNLASHNSFHIAFLRQIPEFESIASQLELEFNQMFNELQSLRANANRRRERLLQEKQQAIFQLQAGQSPNDPKVIKAISDAQLQARKLEADIENNARRVEFQNLLSVAEFRSKREIETLKAANDIRIDQAKSASEVRGRTLEQNAAARNNQAQTR